MARAALIAALVGAAVAGCAEVEPVPKGERLATAEAAGTPDGAGRTRVQTLRADAQARLDAAIQVLAASAAVQPGLEPMVAGRLNAAAHALDSALERSRFRGRLEDAPNSLSIMTYDKKGSQLHFLACGEALLRVEIRTVMGHEGQKRDRTHVTFGAIRLERIVFDAVFKRLSDADWRVAATARSQVPVEYLNTPRIQTHVQAIARRQLEQGTLQGERRARALAALPILFDAPTAGDAYANAERACNALLAAELEARNVEAQEFLKTLIGGDLTLAQRVQLVQYMLLDAGALNEVLTVLYPKAIGAGLVLRKLGIHPNPRLRAVVPLTLPPGSEALPAERVLPDRRAMFRVLLAVLDDDDVRMRFLAADVWEGSDGPRLEGYDPRAPQAERAPALKRLRAVIEAPAPSKQQAPRKHGEPTQRELQATDKSLSALGWMWEVFLREMEREPHNLAEMRTLPVFAKHGLGGVAAVKDGSLRHITSHYRFDIRPRPDGKRDTVWATPPAYATKAPRMWYDAELHAVKWTK